MTFSYLFICNPTRSWHQLIFVKSTGWFFPNHLQNIGACQLSYHFTQGFCGEKNTQTHSNTHLCQPVHHTSPRNPSNGDHGHYTVTWGADLFSVHCASWWREDVGLLLGDVGDLRPRLNLLNPFLENSYLSMVQKSGARKPPGMHNKPCMGSTNLNWWTPVLNVYLPRRCKCEKCVKNKMHRLSWHRLCRVVDWLLVTNVFVVWHAGMGAHPPCENIVIQNT